jgi:hypothetical protein
MKEGRILTSGLCSSVLRNGKEALNAGAPDNAGAPGELIYLDPTGLDLADAGGPRAGILRTEDDSGGEIVRKDLLRRPVTDTKTCQTYVRELESQIGRFAPKHRQQLRKLSRESSRLGDLLYSFPGLAFTLAAGGRCSADRARAIGLVKGGRPLAEAAAVLELPQWLRRLPPEAFTEVLSTVPAGEEFVRNLVNAIPDKTALTAAWLRWVLFGAQACDEAFALWLAKQAIYEAAQIGRIPLVPLAAFAWFSRSSAPARRWIVKAWHANMSFGAAVEETRRWLECMMLDYGTEGAATDGSWFRSRKVCGYSFVPLLTSDMLRVEGHLMRNCAGSYIGKVAAGCCLLYSIRCGDERVAMMEVMARPTGPAIVKLLGPGNTSAGEDVWRAARSWLSKQCQNPKMMRASINSLPAKSSRWVELWKPYRQAKPSLTIYLFDSNLRTLINLRCDLRELANVASFSRIETNEPG